MKRVTARLKDNVCDRSAGAAQFRVEIACGDVYRLNGFERRDEDLQKAGALVVVDALNLVIVSLAQLAVDFGLKRVAGVEELRMLERSASRSRDDVQKVLEISIGAKRNVLG